MIDPTRYASILNVMIETAKARGLDNPGSLEAEVCYELLEAAISDAKTWGVPLEEIGLGGFDTAGLLRKKP